MDVIDIVNELEKLDMDLEDIPEPSLVTSDETVAPAVENFVITRNTAIEGDVSSEANIAIKGVIKGNIMTTRDVNVMQGSLVVGAIAGDRVLVSGKIQGNIMAKKAIRLKRGSYVVGDISSPNIQIDSGAIINGKVTVRR